MAAVVPDMDTTSLPLLPTRMTLVALLVALLAALVPAQPAAAADRDIYVSTSGSDSASGGIRSPLRTVRRAIASARPGDTIWVRGGTYVETAGGQARSGRRGEPITLRAYPGERPVLKGVLQFRDADWWIVDGLRVVDDPNKTAGALVAFKGGSNWVLRNTTISGTRATANLLIHDGRDGPAERFVVRNNCIYDADNRGPLGTDHNIYLFPGLDGDGGRIERNILFDAPNGANVKVGGPYDPTEGPANVTIRYNTMARSPSSIIFYRDGHNNRVERNLITDHTPGDATYRGAVISILTKGRTSRVVDNAWADHPYGYRDYGTVGSAVRVSGHRKVSTGFNRTRSCNGYRPTDSMAQRYGRYASADPLPPDSFVDDDGSIFERDIEWLARRGITAGCNPPRNTRFCPGARVTRGAMAAFLVRGLPITRSSRDFFRDDDNSVFERDIQGLAAADVTAGCNPPRNNRYCPTRGVTRGAMAAFLVRALDLPRSSRDRFRDDDRSVFERDIQALAAAGITAGCNPPRNDRFCPREVVSRAQFAAFLRRALG